MSIFIGVDIGASFIKGALLNLDNLSINHITKFPAPTIVVTKQKSTSPFLRYEINADRHVHLTEQIIKTLLSNAHGNVDGIVFSSQMHGMVLVNYDHRPLTPFIGWQDERSLEVFNVNGKTWMDMFKEKVKDVDTTNTGITLRAGLSGLTMFWLAQQGMLRKYPRSQMMFLGDYVAVALTGGKHIAHPSHACGSALFNVKNNQWDHSILKVLGIEVANMPFVVKTGEVVGNYQHQRRSIPIYVSVGDLQAAVAGGLLVKQQLSINIGTGSQASFIEGEFHAGAYDIRSYFDNQFLYTVTHIPAGRALNVVVNFLSDIGEKFFTQRRKDDIWRELVELVKKKEGSDGVLARITFFKNNTPGFDSGFWQGITEKNWTVENMFYAALENMAENYWAAVQRFGNKRKFKEIVLSGGLVRKALALQRVIKDRFGLKTKMAESEEETLTGLLLVSLVCVEYTSTVSESSELCRKKRIKVWLN